MNGRDRESYYHELFLRRRRDLCRFMTRQPCNNRTHVSNQMDEPDFYMMIPLPLDPDLADNARDMEDEGEVNELHIGGVAHGEQLFDDVNNVDTNQGLEPDDEA